MIVGIVLFIILFISIFMCGWLVYHIDKKYDKKIKQLELSNLDLLHQIKIKEKENE